MKNPTAASAVNPLVVVTDGIPLTTSLAIADGTENEHASVMLLVRTYLADLEQFGPCRFQIDMVKRPQGGGLKREVALLNEQQATLIMTYMRNSEIVREFKIRLVKAFYELAHRQPVVLPSVTSPAKEYRALFGIARLIGLERNHAAISANNAVVKMTGVNLLSMLGETHLVADKQIRHFTPTELGFRIGMSAQIFNKKLAALGYQESRNGSWCSTEAGKEFAVMLDTSKRHGNGVPILQLRWTEDVLSKLGGCGVNPNNAEVAQGVTK
jgi:phage regulator Rha-like protein